MQTQTTFPDVIPNETRVIQVKSHSITLEFYGIFKGEKFCSKHMTPANVKRVMCVHDAYHSVALFLSQKEKCDIAIHNYIPFSFPGCDKYVISYTQKYNYPLVISRYATPVESLLERNGVHKAMGRWCTRIYKIETPRNIYKYFGLAGITQVKGMTKHQSAKRSKMIPEVSEDPLSQKRFVIFQELPIFEMTEEAQIALMEANEIPTTLWIQKYKHHGCMMCPFRNEAYYAQLKTEDNALFCQCESWREAGSRRPRADGTVQQYYYFLKSKII